MPRDVFFVLAMANIKPKHTSRWLGKEERCLYRGSISKGDDVMLKCLNRGMKEMIIVTKRLLVSKLLNDGCESEYI